MLCTHPVVGDLRGARSEHHQGDGEDRLVIRQWLSTPGARVQWWHTQGTWEGRFRVTLYSPKFHGLTENHKNKQRLKFDHPWPVMSTEAIFFTHPTKWVLSDYQNVNHTDLLALFLAHLSTKCSWWAIVVSGCLSSVVCRRPPSTFDVYTLESTFVIRFSWNLVRMFVLTIFRPSLNMGHVWSKLGDKVKS